MMEWVALSAGRCGSECVEYSLNEIIKLNGEVYCFIPKFKTIRKIQNEELIDNRFKDLIMFGADSYE